MGKQRGRRLFLIGLLIGLVLFSSFVLGINKELLGKEKHMKLLAVQETEEGYKGSTADLYLELKEGSGRVFLETFPLTKMDTQISTRFAKEIACDYVKELESRKGEYNSDSNCGEYDFIYTIKAESNIIGGPSAGAAIAALTTITLLDLDYDENIAITGTINSGGIIGPVGKVKEKIEAAAGNGLKEVLVAKGGGISKEDNKTINLITYGRENLSLPVKEVENLNEVIFEFTGKKLKEDKLEVKISPDYQEIMKGLSKLLCGRTEDLEKELKGLEVKEEDLKKIKEKKNSSEASLEKGDYYSASSFCFGTNILIKDLIFDKKEVGVGWVKYKLDSLGKKVNLLEEKLKGEKIETISDLQTMMIVKERLDEVKGIIEKFNESEDRNYALAYAEERYFSAVSWMNFFKMEGKEFIFDNNKLKESCIKKISEGEERYQYVELIFGESNVGHIQDKIDEATKNLNSQDYDLCLIKAVQAKAEANAISSVMGLSEDNFDEFLESKTKATEKVIAENSAEGIFPILGYSYYQYANSLKESDKESALLYLEYALEMSNLDIYFEEEKGAATTKKFKLSAKEGLLLGEGFVSGVMIAGLVFLIFFRNKIKVKRKKTKRKR